MTLNIEPLTSSVKPPARPAVGKTLLGLIGLAITVGILIAGLWPFNFWPENKVRWLKGQHGIEFYGQGIVFSTFPMFDVLTRNTQLAARNNLFSSTLPLGLALLTHDPQLATRNNVLASNSPSFHYSNVPIQAVSTRNSQPVTRNNLLSSTIPPFHSSNIPEKSPSIVLSLQSTTEETPHLGHIFSFLNDDGSEAFFVGQLRSHLILGKGKHGKKSYREMGMRDILKKGDKRFVTITSGVGGTSIYVDGNLMKSNAGFRLLSMNDEPSGRIVLGNSPTGDEYWTGNLLSLAIYDRALKGEGGSQDAVTSKGSGQERPTSRYFFDERSGTLAHDSVSDRHLVIPPRFEVLKKTVLVPPWEDFALTRSYMMDVLTNVLGFIPFGFFFSAYLRMRKQLTNSGIFLLSVIIAGCISLLIELTQVYLPTRNSQLTDVITNTLGALLGVGILLKVATRNS